MVKCATEKKGRQVICHDSIGDFNKWIEDAEVLEISSVENSNIHA